MTVKKENIKFFGKFFIIFFVLFGAVSLLDLSSLQTYIAEFEAGIFGLNTEGTLILMAGFAFEITKFCTGIFSVILLASTVFTFKKPNMKSKIVLLVVGSLALLIVNFVRVYGIILAGHLFGLGIAELVHVISWLILAASVIAVWFVLNQKITKNNNLHGYI